MAKLHIHHFAPAASGDFLLVFRAMWFLNEKLIFHQKDFIGWDSHFLPTTKISKFFLRLGCASMTGVWTAFHSVRWWQRVLWPSSVCLERLVGVTCHCTPPSLSLLLVLSSLDHSPAAQVVLGGQEQSWSSDFISSLWTVVLKMNNLLKSFCPHPAFLYDL